MAIWLTSVVGESQPVYEEFGAILLLVLTVTYRYELTTAQLRISSTTSFVQHLLEAEAAEEPLDDLNGSKRKHLGDWIAALFVADSLSDELTSSCSPREFYRILPTLLSQSIAACACGKLSVEILKSGFDCESAQGTLCRMPLMDNHRPTGAFLAPLSRCSAKMACQSLMADIKGGQDFVVPSPLTDEATVINRGTGDTSDNSHISS